MRLRKQTLNVTGNNINNGKNLMKWKTSRIIKVMTVLRGTLNLKCYVRGGMDV